MDLFENSTKSIDEFAEVLASNTKIELNERNKPNETKSHKDPLVESNKYLSKNDVYEIFKLLTVNLVLNKPSDPIKSMIDQVLVLKAENDSKYLKN